MVDAVMFNYHHYRYQLALSNEFVYLPEVLIHNSHPTSEHALSVRPTLADELAFYFL